MENSGALKCCQIDLIVTEINVTAQRRNGSKVEKLYINISIEEEKNHVRTKAKKDLKVMKSRSSVELESAE